MEVNGGTLGGWVDGSGTPVLMLHGGPGMSFNYLDNLAEELGEGFEIASFQQRGIAPSMTDGPFDIATHVADVAAVLDALEWQMAYVVGHSWGGHLGFHLAVAVPERLLGVLAVDPLGAVGDGGAAEFSAEMLARASEDAREKLKVLDEREAAEGPSEADSLEHFSLVWPGYFADPPNAPPVPDLAFSVPASAGGFPAIFEQLPALEAGLASISVPIAIAAGARSPIPTAAQHETVDRIPGAWIDVVDGAGHLPWYERPGCVRAALLRLAEG